jgi:plastocyanin
LPADPGNKRGMRKLILTLVAFASLAAVGHANAATTKDINITGSGFSPSSVTITAGDTIKWVNKDNANHQIYGQGGRFISPILGKNQSWTFTFNAAGSYSYKDELHPKLTGSITVKGAPPSLTLESSKVYSTFGDDAAVSGVISSHQAGQQVAIFYQPYPAPNMMQRTVVLTGTGGTYSFNVSPEILTSYQASWNGAYSQPVTIQVQPKLSIGRNGAWILHASGGHGFAGHSVQFQRYNAATGQWVTLTKVDLNSRSSARITVTLPKGMNRLRLAMSVNAAGPGFLAGFSPELNWVQK